MITPAYGLTATERVLPSFTLDWTTGLVQSTVDVTRAGVATFVGSNGLIQSATADTQRIDYSTGVAGLLVEESRTNLFAYSQDIDDPTWQKGAGLVVTQNAAIAPDGTMTAELLDGTGTTNFINQIVSLTAGVTYTISFYVKSAGLGKDKFRLFADTSKFSGEFTATDTWQRYTYTFTGALTGTRNNGLTRNAANDPLGVFVWGAQLEAGAFPTSYIPTEASAVTRNADQASITGVNFSGFYNQTEGTVACEFVPFNPSGTPANLIYSLSDNTANNRMMHYIENGNILVLTRVAGVGSNNFATGYTYTTSPTKSVFGYSASGNALAAAGNATNTTAQADPTVDRLYIGANQAGGVVGSKYIRKLLYYPHKLTNAEIQAFSK